MQRFTGFGASGAAEFGVTGDGALAVVAEVVGGQSGVAEFILNDVAGGLAEAVVVTWLRVPRRSQPRLRRCGH